MGRGGGVAFYFFLASHFLGNLLVTDQISKTSQLPNSTIPTNTFIFISHADSHRHPMFKFSNDFLSHTDRVSLSLRWEMYETETL